MSSAEDQAVRLNCHLSGMRVIWDERGPPDTWDGITPPVGDERCIEILQFEDGKEPIVLYRRNG